MSAPVFELTPTGTWVQNAACGGRWDLMEGIGEDNERHAKMLCRGCPVRADCDEWVLSLTQRYDPEGVVAEMNASERAKRRRKRHRRAVPLAPRKDCRRCGDPKPLDQFPPRRGRKDGRDSYCRSCHAGLARERAAAEPTREAAGR